MQFNANDTPDPNEVSQSLIHQVSVSDDFKGATIEGGLDRLNPLFIRSQFQMAAFFQTINTDT